MNKKQSKQSKLFCQSCLAKLREHQKKVKRKYRAKLKLTNLKK